MSVMSAYNPGPVGASSETIGALCCNSCMRAFDDLRLFEHLAGTLHYGRSAAECHVTPSTLSRTISRLEAETGVRLFDRDRRTVRLTPDGVRFLEFAREVLAAWEGFGDPAADAAHEVTGTVSLFCTATASQTLVPAALARFRDSYPGVHLAIETGYAAEALARLLDDAVDVTIAPLPPRPPGQILAHVLASTPLVLVGAVDTAHALTPTVSPSWATVPFLLPATGLVRTLIDRWFRRLRVTPTVAAEANGHEAILSLVLLGCGIGVIPELVARQSLSAGRLRVLAVDEPMPAFDIAACTRPARLEHRPTRVLWQSLTG
jgi:LysR family transcriptional regulator, positive regulator for ilvC